MGWQIPACMHACMYSLYGKWHANIHSTGRLICITGRLICIHVLIRFPLYICIYILLGVHTPTFNIPHIRRYYTSLSFSIYLIYEDIIPLYHFQYTLLIILIFLNTGSMKKIIKTLSCLIYHFYVQKFNIYADNIRYMDSS
jgi:hypothetical protein